MASNSPIFIALCLAIVVLELNTWTCKEVLGEEAIKKSCKPWETFGCISPTPGCGENKCGEAKRPNICAESCGIGCWCRGSLYRRKRDNKCVPIHECPL
uniref:Putative cysteine-rich antimicrobial peptide n=1 Tax=Rhipicephalus microplus TaxID=6941 RepID=A0A6G5A8V3_RHIMP